MAPSALDLPRPFGPYELVRRLASGNVVDVYFAQARSVAGFQKAVAIKVIREAHVDDDPEFVRQLVEEANIAARLSHKNIVQVIDLGELEGQHYIAMEYVDGIDLAKLLARLGPRRAVSPRVAAYILREVCEGLDHAHRKLDADAKPLRIVHRDVSPPNILLSSAGEVKLTDFGLAKASLRAASTQAGQIKGKYAYMSPEQARGHAVDARTDVFAAGLLLYELVTGRQAYPDAPLPILLERLTRGLIEPAEKIDPTLPPALTAILRRATAADVAQRHPSARALADDLTVFLYTQEPKPEAELAQLLEAVSDSARSHLAPLGPSILDDLSDEVTSLEAASKAQKTVLTSAAAGKRRVESARPPPAAPRSQPPRAATPPGTAAARSQPPSSPSSPGVPALPPIPRAPRAARVGAAPSDPPPPDVKSVRTPAPLPAAQPPSGRPPPPPAARVASDPPPAPPVPSVPPPPAPAASPRDTGSNSILRAPSLPGPQRPRPAAPLADEHPTEVMASEGPDAELLRTAAAVAPLVQRPSPPPAPEPPAVSAAAPPPPPVAAPPPPVPAPAQPGAASVQPVAAPAPPVASPAPAPAPSPDVTAQHMAPRRSQPPRTRQGPIYVAVGVGVVVGVVGALVAVFAGR